jgi:putative phosphoribosyl transferase
MDLTNEAHDTHRLVSIPIDRVELEGDLAAPLRPRGIVLFAHGSGSSRHSPRNRFVAESLRREARVATLLFDLLSPAEEAIDAQSAALRFDIGLLARRLLAATDWVRRDAQSRALRVGYFGASTGAAAALVAAANRPEGIGAIVSRGGRPDLAGGAALARVIAPTLLIVGGEDYPVIDMNREAMAQLEVEREIEVVPGAGHLFEEPGTLGAVARLAARWFERYLNPGRGRVRSVPSE